MNDYLTGQNANLSTVLDTFVDKAKGATIQGNDLVLTLVPRAQRAAQNALGSRCGAVVALEVKTGKVLAMYSSPTYDPNLVEEQLRPGDGRPRRLPASRRAAEPRHRRPLRAGLDLQGGDRVGGDRLRPLHARLRASSTRATARSTASGSTTTTPRARSAASTCTRRSSTRSTRSSATSARSWARRFLVAYMKRFGFYEKPPLETPANERAASGLYKGRKLFDPKEDTDVDPGRMAFGQERLLVTPLQMAMVAATIANDGVVMKPQVVDRIVAPDGSIVDRSKPDELGRAVKAETARTVAAMMKDAVEEGTGTAARSRRHGRRQDGHRRDRDRRPEHDLVHRYAGKDRPQVAIAAVVEQQNSTGGQTAAPVAREVLQALLGSTANS